MIAPGRDDHAAGVQAEVPRRVEQARAEHQRLERSARRRTGSRLASGVARNAARDSGCARGARAAPGGVGRAHARRRRSRVRRAALVRRAPPFGGASSSSPPASLSTAVEGGRARADVHRQPYFDQRLDLDRRDAERPAPTSRKAARSPQWLSVEIIAVRSRAEQLVVDRLDAPRRAGASRKSRSMSGRSRRFGFKKRSKGSR